MSKLRTFQSFSGTITITTQSLATILGVTGLIRYLKVQNQDAAIHVFIGGSGVLAAGTLGYRIVAGVTSTANVFELDLQSGQFTDEVDLADIYLVAASGTPTVSVNYAR